MTTDAITDPAVRRLTTDLQRLRNEQTALLTANSTLVDWGITSGSVEVFDRLRAIKNLAQVIAARLDALGAEDAAYDAVQGWALIPPTHRATAQVAS